MSDTQTTEEKVILVEQEDGVATVTLNRPRVLNALSNHLIGTLTRTFRELAEAGDADVVILTGAGRAFSAGVDLKELSQRPDGEGAGRVDVDTLPAAIREFPGPIIGAINGVAVTGGFELALMCDFMIASSEARFADTHARVGVMPGWGLSQRLPRLIGVGRARELSFTGNYLDAETAERWGLVNRVVAPSELLPVCRELAASMRTCDPGTLRGVKRVIADGWEMPLAEGLRMEAEASRAHWGTVRGTEVGERFGGLKDRGRQQQ